MNQKEIKSLLKSVKDNLDQKDFKTALKQCVSILKVDRNNYLALVFYGAAVQETEQKDEAPKAFKKAIEVSPEHLLAWRGLASYYEKNETKDTNDLLKVYSRLLVLETDETKIPEIVEKFEKLSKLQIDLDSIKMIFDSLGSCSDHKKVLLQQCLVNILSLKPDFPEDIISNFLILLEELTSMKPILSNHVLISKLYLVLLYKQRNLKKVITKASEFMDLHPEDVTFLEWICKAYTELSDSDYKDLVNFSPKEAYSKLLQLQSDSYLAYFCKGVDEFQSGNLLNANESFKEAIKFESSSVTLWLKLCTSQIVLFQFLEAEESCRKAISLVKKNEKTIIRCKIQLLKCLCNQNCTEKLLEAETLGKELRNLNENDMEVLEYLITAQMKLKKFVEAEEKLKVLNQDDMYKPTARYLKCCILQQQNSLEDFKNSLEEFVKETPNHYESWLELGKIYYNENNCDSALSCLLKSAKLNQWCYESFLFLGHCYKNMVHDLEKARRCYQKAFQLNPSNMEAGSNLSDVFRILKKEELNFELLSTITTMNPSSKWAWFKLGLHYLCTNQYQNALNSLRVVVRLDANDENAWECLGDAYYAQGAYTSALKSYQRVRELKEGSVYSVLQIANIKRVIGLFSESVQEFRQLIDQIPDYIPALKGHAEACLALMRHYLSQNLNGLAHDACQEAAISIVKCLHQRKDLICFWKLLGDTCILLSSLPEKYCHLKLALWLSSNSEIENSNEVVLNKTQILKLGSRSFCQAIALNSSFSRLWYDLAFTYNLMVEVSNTVKSKKQMRELACSAVKKSILLNENSWESWNLYGMILASKEIQNYYLAQHCFIKSILKNDTNAVTWTNLGTLYLDLDDLQIANQCFTEAQRCDHDYVYCWVGQAIIAQKTGHHDAMDLFRHSTQLGFSCEGCLGYSNLVCVTLLNTKNKNDKNYLYNIKNMNAVTVASKILTWFTDRFPTNPWAFNMLGLLLERQMLYRGATNAFYEALRIVRSEKVSEKEKDYTDITDKILLNYSRVLSNVKRYTEAIEHLKQIKKASFTNQCELAIAYFRAQLYEEAYATYGRTLEWLASDAELKSHILVAMATVVYMHQGPEDAKILLMQSCQLKPPSVEGLFALCALGMLHSDLALSELALRELVFYEKDVRYVTQMAVFEAYMYLFKGQKKRAVQEISRYIHNHPDNPSLWLNLCLFFLHLYPSYDSRHAAKYAETAFRNGRTSIDISKVMSLVSLSNLLSNEGLSSLKASQKAVHSFPDVAENWVVLLASVLSKCLIRPSPEEIFCLKKMIFYLRRKNFKCSESMAEWLSNNDKKISMMATQLGCRFTDFETKTS